VPTPLLLAVDGNSLLHRAHHAWAASGDRDAEGRPIWGVIGLTVAIAAAASRCAPDAMVVGFDCGRRSIRRELFAGYKAHRPEKSPDLQAQLEAAPGLLAAAGVPIVQESGYEADDVLASAAALARRNRWRAVLVTSDRDAFALVDETTSVLRVVNGGMDDSPMVTPTDLLAAYQVPPERYRDLAVLRGDPSDNLPGAPGVGGRTAARLLTTFGGLEHVYAALDDGRTNEVAALAGPTATALLASAEGRCTLAHTRDLMTQRDDLPMPAPEALLLPLDGVRLRTTLAARGIRLGRSLWALVGEERPAWLPNGFDKAPSFLPGSNRPWAVSTWFRRDTSNDVSTTGPGDPATLRGPSSRRRRPVRASCAVLPGQLPLF